MAPVLDRPENDMRHLWVLLLLVVPLLACGEEEELPPDRRPLLIAFDGSPTNLDARVGNDQNSGRVFDLIYIGLVHVATDGTYEPVVAESWEMPDDTTIVFHIRPGLVFHDGTPLTARDVKFTYESLMAEGFPGAKASGYADVERIETPDDMTVVFHLAQANAGIFDNLTLGIVPEGSDTEVMKSRPVGAGPYRLVEYAVDERVRLEGFDRYWKGPPGIRDVVIRVVPDATTRILELRKGTIDFELNAIPYDAVKLFRKIDDFQVVAKPGSQYQYLAFNLRNRYLSNLQVRQAIAHAIDRDRIVRDLLLGFGTVTNSLFPADHWAHAEGLTDYPYDPARAKALLDQAGLKDPDGDGPAPRFQLSFRTSTDAEANLQAQMIQQMLREVGIAVEIRSNEFGVFYDDISKGNFDMFSLKWAGLNDPDFYTYIFLSENIPPTGLNRGFFINPRVDELIERGRVTYDREERKRIYGEIQRIAAEQLPYYSLYHRSNVAVMKEELEGFRMYPAGFLLALDEMHWEGGGGGRVPASTAAPSPASTSTAGSGTTETVSTDTGTMAQ